MSNILDRLVCTSANGERASVDADDIRALLDLYEASPGEHPRPDGPFHLNESLADRAFGGPQEGGGWYDTDRFVAGLGALHRLVGASHRAASGRGLPEGPPALRVAAPPRPPPRTEAGAPRVGPFLVLRTSSPPPLGPRERASLRPSSSGARRRRSPVGIETFRSRPRSPVMPSRCIVSTGDAP